MRNGYPYKLASSYTRFIDSKIQMVLVHQLAHPSVFLAVYIHSLLTILNHEMYNMYKLKNRIQTQSKTRRHRFRQPCSTGSAMPAPL